MFDRDATEALIRHSVAAFTAGGIGRILDVNVERQAQLMICHDLQDRITRVALG